MQNVVMETYQLISKNKLVLGLGTTITLLGIVTSSQVIAKSPAGSTGNSFAVICLSFNLITFLLFVLIIARQVNERYIKTKKQGQGQGQGQGAS